MTFLQVVHDTVPELLENTNAKKLSKVIADLLDLTVNNDSSTIPVQNVIDDKLYSDTNSNTDFSEQVC